MDAVRDEPRREHDEKDIGGGEDHRQIYPEREAEEGISECECRKNAERPADKLTRLCDDAARFQIQDGLGAFAQDRCRGKDEDAGAVSLLNVTRDIFLDLFRDIFLPVHPENHPRDGHGGHEHQYSLEKHFRPAREPAEKCFEDDCQEYGGENTRSDAAPHVCIEKPLVGLHEEGENNADNNRRFKGFPESYEQGDEHIDEGYHSRLICV